MTDPLTGPEPELSVDPVPAVAPGDLSPGARGLTFGAEPDATPGAAADVAPGPGPYMTPDAVPSRRAALATGLTRLAVVLLCALLGFALVVQVRRTASGDSLTSARPDDLVQILDGLQHREDDLGTETATLQDTLARLRSSGASSAEALAEAQRQALALGILTGTVAAGGPGVSIVISDPSGAVPPEVLLDAIQELRNAGAEAFQVGPVRIGVQSAFTGSAGAIVLDGIALRRPYTIDAIGDPPTLSAALSIPGGVLDTVRRAGGSMKVSQSERIVINALRRASTPLYAQPAGG